jgi:hypothetical protein
VKRSITLTCFLGLALPAVGQAQEEDDLVRQAFVQAFGKRPADSPSTALVPSPEIDAAITAGRSAVAAPSDRALQAEFTDRLGSVIDSQVRGNLHELLFVVFKESMAELQEDKKYYLEKLARMNQMGVALSDYLEELAGASRELGEMERGTSGPARSARTASITVRTFDPVWVESLAGPSVHNRSIVCDPCLTTREATLNAEQIQREQESVLGVQRRLQATLQEAEMRHAELDMGTEAVVRMLAEVLEAVDEESGGAVRGTLSGPTLQR